MIMETYDAVNNGPLKGQRSFKVKGMQIRSKGDKAKEWLNTGRGIAMVYPQTAASEKTSMQKTKSKQRIK